MTSDGWGQYISEAAVGLKWPVESIQEELRTANLIAYLRPGVEMAKR